MVGRKNSMRAGVAVHAPQHKPVRNTSQIREPNGRVIHKVDTPAARMPFDDGMPMMAEGLGGLCTEFDEVESLSDFVNTEFRLMMAELG